MNIRQLELFMAIVRTGSFQGAAKDSFTTQSTVSQHIALLEEELGVQLLERSRGGVWMTEAGKALYGHARNVIGELTAAREAITDLSRAGNGTLRIAASTVPATYLVPAALAAMGECFPGISVDLRQRNSGQVAELLLEHRSDVGVVGQKPEEKSLTGEFLLKEEICLVCGPRHPWAGRRSVGVSEFKDTPFVARTEGSGTEKTVLEKLQAKGADLDSHNVKLRVETSESVKAAVAAGIGVSFLSRLAASAEIARGELVCVPVDGLKIERDFFLIRRATFRMNKVASAFWEEMIRTCWDGNREKSGRASA